MRKWAFIAGAVLFAIGCVGNRWNTIWKESWGENPPPIGEKVVNWLQGIDSWLITHGAWPSFIWLGLLIVLVAWLWPEIVGKARGTFGSSTQDAAPKGVERNHDQQPSEIIEIMRHIGRLKDLLLTWRPIEEIEPEVKEKYVTIEDSDLLVWQEDGPRRLRNDFLNRCGIIYHDRRMGVTDVKELEKTKEEMKDFAAKLLAELRSYRGP